MLVRRDAGKGRGTVRLSVQHYTVGRAFLMKSTSASMASIGVDQKYGYSYVYAVTSSRKSVRDLLEGLS